MKTAFLMFSLIYSSQNISAVGSAPGTAVTYRELCSVRYRSAAFARPVRFEDVLAEIEHFEAERPPARPSGPFLAQAGRAAEACAAAQNLYADEQAQSAAQTNQPARLNLPDLAAELSRCGASADLRRLRRRCALAAHPDRVAAPDRARAEKWLAEANASIDRALRRKN
jgi:hypothetical protein